MQLLEYDVLVRKNRQVIDSIALKRRAQDEQQPITLISTDTLHKIVDELSLEEMPILKGDLQGDFDQRINIKENENAEEFHSRYSQLNCWLVKKKSYRGSGI